MTFSPVFLEVVIPSIFHCSPSTNLVSTLPTTKFTLPAIICITIAVSTAESLSLPGVTGKNEAKVDAVSISSRTGTSSSVFWEEVNSLTTTRVLAGKRKFPTPWDSYGRNSTKNLSTTNTTNPQTSSPWWAVGPFSGVDSMDPPNPTQGPSSEGVTPRALWWGFIWMDSVLA